MALGAPMFMMAMEVLVKHFAPLVMREIEAALARGDDPETIDWSAIVPRSTDVLEAKADAARRRKA